MAFTILVACLSLGAEAPRPGNAPGDGQSPAPSSFANTRETRTATPPGLLTVEMRGDIFMARKMYREAVDMYKQMPSDSPVTWNKVGIAYHQMLDLDAAKKYYEKSVKMRPNYPEAVNNLGTIHYAKKSYRRAVSYYKKALKLNPQSASILSNLGTAYFARKQYELAFKSYQQALAIDPEVFEHRGAAGVLLQERTVEERAKFHFYLAKTYAKAGQNDRAMLYLRKALEEGFKDRDKLKEEPEFAGLQQLPEFQELLAYQPKVL
jgi:tetratricopeptide (TPR) repeat protein